MIFDSTLSIPFHICDIGNLNMDLGVINNAEYESDMQFGHMSKVKVIN